MTTLAKKKQAFAEEESNQLRAGIRTIRGLIRDAKIREALELCDTMAPPKKVVQIVPDEPVLSTEEKLARENADLMAKLQKFGISPE